MLYIPLGQAQQEVTARPLHKGSDAEPARLAVVLGAAVAGDGVADELAAGGGLVHLGGVGQVADDVDPGNGARGGGGEGAGGAGRDVGGAAEEEGRHVESCSLGFVGVGRFLCVAGKRRCGFWVEDGCVEVEDGWGRSFQSCMDVCSRSRQTR